MTITLLVLVVLLTDQQAGTPAGRQPHQQEIHDRGSRVMGFDQDRTVHHFRLHPDGGAIDISVKDPGDLTNRDAIRAHLPHIASMFGEGNFDAPMLIHATDVPGAKTMAALKNRLRFVYVETRDGGRLDVFTTDAAAVEAVHEFLRFQIRDHGTGDTTAVVKR